MSLFSHGTGRRIVAMRNVSTPCLAMLLQSWDREEDRRNAERLHTLPRHAAFQSWDREEDRRDAERLHALPRHTDFSPCGWTREVIMRAQFSSTRLSIVVEHRQLPVVI